MDIKHKELRRFWMTGDTRGVPDVQAKRLDRRLDALAHANIPREIDMLGYRLHPLTGRMAGWWSIRVSGNWRLTFRFDAGKVVDVDLVDSH